METIFRIELNIIGIFISIVVIMLFYHQIKLKTKKDTIFITIAFVTLTELVLDTIFWLIDGKNMNPILNVAVNTFYYFFQIFQCFMLMMYARIQMGYEDHINKIYRLSFFLILGTTQIIFNVFNGGIFSVDAQNVYHRTWGLWGWLYASFCMFYIFLAIAMTVYQMIKGDKEQRRNGRYLLGMIMIPVISSAMQMAIYGLNFIWIGMAMVQLLMFVEIEVKNYQIMMHELTEQKIQIMMSQIQPHFLYNTLSVIQSLTHGKAPEAEEAIVQFSTFLRGNLDSLTMVKPIQFEKEWNHTKNYLELEKKRFAQRLNISYDIQTTSFRVPALTLQPIVENAVRYGICKREEGGTIWISTKEDTRNYIITVKDNGVGFDVTEKKEDDRSHIGISNVKTRLEKMSGGILEIQSTIGIGTTVNIYIPK